MEILRIEEFLEAQGFTQRRKTKTQEIVNSIKDFLNGKASKGKVITEFSGKKLEKPLLMLKASDFGEDSLSFSGLQLAVRENDLKVRLAVKELFKAKSNSKTASRCKELLVIPE